MREVFPIPFAVIHTFRSYTACRFVDGGADGSIFDQERFSWVKSVALCFGEVEKCS